MSDLHTKYRPSEWDEVLGNESLIKSLRLAVEEGSCHAFILQGPSGCGKTTLARIVASSVGCESMNIIEIDAASHTGVDDMRGLCERLKYVPMGESPARALIIDEAHRLSQAAWSSLLKSVEEPPKDTYWIFCTTDPDKIPQTIKTRCGIYKVSPVDKDILYDYLKDIAVSEEWEILDGIIERIAKESRGSTRQALVYLAAVRGCEDEREAAKIIQSAYESKGIIDLCRLLLSGKGLNWPAAMRIVGEMEEEEESARLAIIGYMAKVAEGAESDRVAGRALEIIQAFDRPFFNADKHGMFLLSLGKIILNGE